MLIALAIAAAVFLALLLVRQLVCVPARFNRADADGIPIILECHTELMQAFIIDVEGDAARLGDRRSRGRARRQL